MPFSYCGIGSFCFCIERTFVESLHDTPVLDVRFVMMVLQTCCLAHCTDGDEARGMGLTFFAAIKDAANQQ